MPIYVATKTYTAAEGLSCCFRQWKADSQCRLLHGYALSFKLVFECHHLDDNNWAMDFGGLSEIKAWLKTQFDHTMVVADDDPALATFQALSDQGLCDLRVLPGVGCEKFAEYVFKHVIQWMKDQGLIQRVTIRSVECSEHDGNTAMYIE
jgi:6-pyruvoyltetrahydropterin/6-carboxytetrahydropterin synthase